jgi:large subunit ribosomal protein L18
VRLRPCEPEAKESRREHRREFAAGVGPRRKLKTMKIKTKDDRRRRIQVRQRKRIAGSKDRPRLSVFRSVTHIYAQVIDDMSGQTLVSASSIDAGLKGAFPKGVRGGNIKGAEAIGKAIAERSIEKGIKRVVFDRSGFLYHGRIRAVADAARKAGLEF